MNYSINARRKILGNYDVSTSEDEEQLLDDGINSDNPSYEPSVFFKTTDVQDRY